jgi:hypothetical protein
MAVKCALYLAELSDYHLYKDFVSCSWFGWLFGWLVG